MGQQGTELHEDLVNWSRFDLIPYLRTVFADIEWLPIYAQGLVASELGTKLCKQGGESYPDGIWFYNGYRLLVEVGRYNLAKLPQGEQLLHIGWDGEVSIVNPKDSFVLDVVDAIKAYRIEFGSPSPHAPPGYAWL